MIKPSFEALGTPGNHSFLLRDFKEHAFSAPYHFHPEYELTFIVKGMGKRFVGSNMENYQSGDLVLLGANLPHCWKTEDAIEGEINAHSVVVQFQDNFLGEHFLSKPECLSINHLLLRSAGGLRFTNKTQELVCDKMMTLATENDNFKRLISLLEILHSLAVSDSVVVLNNYTYTAQQSPEEQQRINRVFAYLVEHFRQRVSLNEAAAVANMSPNAFCKYFKKATRKTFMEMVIDYRINYASQQLAYSNKPVSQICFDSGFSDVSHFHKLFRAKMKISPLAYRKNFRQKL
ncbi:AraC family transcriptional regulator [Pedobacter sp. BS3]|uniref:AraC family transcriptional regulator n=1 Tax=Pedobacter sp. BS3 TaxID=2567937 RepID=UPI0011ED0C4B|nr:AraC family transcriptional regulator [Pedobacter sp. BS3]TZF83187.1 AraC family transcriptional regulator [Pedobacter sp. BS3]